MTRPLDLHRMVHTAVMELPEETPVDDILDAICGMMPWADWLECQDQAAAMVRQYR
jgi:hypothetical protein